MKLTKYSKTQQGQAFLGLIFAFSMLINACKRDDLTVIKPNENIRPAADFIKNNYEMTLFSQALTKAGLTTQLNGAGPFTVLVPTDAAFNELGIYKASDLDKINADSLKKLISYHILPRRLTTREIPTNGVDVRYATLEGSELYTSYGALNPNGGSAEELYFSGAKVTRNDVVMANGVLHVVNKLMKPQFKNNIQQWLLARKEYSVFVEGLKKFDLWAQLAQNGPYTIFAPTNDALAKSDLTSASLASLEKSKYDGDLLFGSYIIYGRHFFISDGQVFSIINSNGTYSYKLKNNIQLMEFSSGESYPSYILGYSLLIRSGSGIFDPIVNSVRYEIPSKVDYLCSNGLLHNLEDGLVTPSQALKP